jgi:hypothetical protein
MPGRLVDILLIGIEKGIDGGDDMPGLCVRINDQMGERAEDGHTLENGTVGSTRASIGCARC